MALAHPERRERGLPAGRKKSYEIGGGRNAAKFRGDSVDSKLCFPFGTDKLSLTLSLDLLITLVIRVIYPVL